MEDRDFTGWVIDAMRRAGLTQEALAERMGFSSRMIVNNLVKGRRRLSAQDMLAISEITGMPLPAGSSDQVEIAGRVGAGAVVPLVEPYPRGSGPKVLRPPELRGIGVVAVEVEGDSMLPIYDGGDLLFYRRAHVGIDEAALNHIAVAEDDDGNVWVKHLKRGTEPGLFHLLSFNLASEPMFDVRLAWAAKVLFHLPREHAERIEEEPA